MALIKCPECGHQVSTFAAACPQCGCPIGEEQVAAAQQPAPAPTPQPAPVPQPAAPVQQPAPTPPQRTEPAADSVVLELPGPPPNGALAAPSLQIGDQRIEWEWGKTVTARIPSARNCLIRPKGYLANSIGAALAMGIGVMFIFISIVAGEGMIFFFAALLFVSGIMISTGAYQCLFPVMPGKRYKLYWEKKLTGYKLKAQEIHN